MVNLNTNTTKFLSSTPRIPDEESSTEKNSTIVAFVNNATVTYQDLSNNTSKPLHDIATNEECSLTNPDDMSHLSVYSLLYKLNPENLILIYLKTARGVIKRETCNQSISYYE
mmetsp:Transcript_3497/g.5208  ORF Transcript_3497/g.5208 Transcript_3497/m.5208 type:complete len:113 (+) Transcript_3497:104-442(+)